MRQDTWPFIFLRGCSLFADNSGGGGGGGGNGSNNDNNNNINANLIKYICALVANMCYASTPYQPPDISKSQTETDISLLLSTQHSQ